MKLYCIHWRAVPGLSSSSVTSADLKTQLIGISVNNFGLKLPQQTLHLSELNYTNIFKDLSYSRCNSNSVTYLPHPCNKNQLVALVIFNLFQLLNLYMFRAGLLLIIRRHYSVYTAIGRVYIMRLCWLLAGSCQQPVNINAGHIQSVVYRVSQEECARLRESVPYVKVYRYNPKHQYPKSNGYGDNGQRKVRASCGSKYCNLHSWCVARQRWWPWEWNAVLIVPAWLLGACTGVGRAM